MQSFQLREHSSHSYLLIEKRHPFCARNRSFVRSENRHNGPITSVKRISRSPKYFSFTADMHPALAGSLMSQFSAALPERIFEAPFRSRKKHTRSLRHAKRSLEWRLTFFHMALWLSSFLISCSRPIRHRPQLPT